MTIYPTCSICGKRFDKLQYIALAQHMLYHVASNREETQPMKAISIWQPWAELIARGFKHYETRSWSTNYRGPIAIHAGKSREGLKLYSGGHIDIDVFGAVLAIGTLNAVKATGDAVVSDRERELGDWTPGRFAWRIMNVRLVKPAYELRGRQGLFDVPPDEVVEIMKRVK